MTKIFNLKKYAQQSVTQPLIENPVIQQPQVINPGSQLDLNPPQDPAALRDILDQQPDASSASQILIVQAKNKNKPQIINQIPQLMENYFESTTPLTPFQKLDLANFPLWKALWESQETPVDTVQGVQHKQLASIAEQIKKIAQNDAKIKTAKTKVFNLAKVTDTNFSSND